MRLAASIIAATAGGAEGGATARPPGSSVADGVAATATALVEASARQAPTTGKIVPRFSMNPLHLQEPGALERMAEIGLPIGFRRPLTPEESSQMFVSKAAVVGGGTMGGEIAQAIAAADVPVVVKDVEQKFVDAALEKARAVTEGQLARLVKKEKLTKDAADARLAEVMGLIVGTTTYDGFGDVDFVVEAVPERMEIKQAVFAELDEQTPGHAVLASNTSALSISE